MRLKKLAFLLFLSLSGFTLQAQVCDFRLTGHLEDADTREKLTGAIVSIRELGMRIITDDKGDFLFEHLCPGPYTIIITHVDCDTIEKVITLSKDMHLDLIMPHARKTLGEVVVEAQKGVANTGFKQELAGRALEETKGFSLAEALSRINGVTQLQTGSTISKPVIHGLHGSRILTINNGVRQEGQQWGNEHAPEIDPFIADKLVVIKGVDELKYGSDAIAGVILVEPRPLRLQSGYAAEINSAYFTNNRQYVFSGTWEQQVKKWAGFRYRLQGTFKKGATISTPHYRLNNTANQEANFSVTAGWKKDRFNTELYYSFFSTQVGIFTGSHIGNLTDLQNAIAASRPDPVFLGENSYSIARPYQDVAHHLARIKTSFYKREHRFNVLVATQINNRKEYDIVRSSSNTRPQLDLSILTLSEEIQWEQPRKNNFSGTAGIASSQQNNTYGGRYFIPNYDAFNIGAYFIEKWTHHNWEVQGGLRFDHKLIQTRRLKYNGDTINNDFQFTTLAASTNIIYRPSARWKANLGISLSSRAPYVNELLSDGIHHGTATYERGNIFLKPEKAFHFTANLNYNKGPFQFDWVVYTHLIHDFIYQQPKPDSPVLTIAGAFPLIVYQQTNAVLSGSDLAFSWRLFPALEWQSKWSVLFARDQTRKDWLIWMPANRINNELTYTFKDGKKLTGSYISLEVQHVMRQNQVPSEKNGKQDYKAPPPSYHLLHLNASTTIHIRKQPVTIAVTGRNLLNTVYREYLNSMRYFTDEMGRNVGIRVKVPISKS